LANLTVAFLHRESKTPTETFVYIVTKYLLIPEIFPLLHSEIGDKAVII